MGFFKQQEQILAARLLSWRYERLNMAPPPEAELNRLAAKMVADAHGIARERGSNVLGILKEMIANYVKK